ncbi:ATP-binding protein, partial [Streptomyces sp. PA03-2a]
MIADLDYGLLPDESEDHFLGLEQAQLVGTDTLLTTRDNIEAVIEAKAMMCVYGPAGSGKTMSVNSALRHLAPDITHRLELRAGPTPRDIRHGLFQALGLPGEPPARPIEFDTLLKEALAEEFRVLVCD